MSPRLKVRAAATPLVVAGALWCSGALPTALAGGGPQTPPPCGPDGICIPRPQTYGWYQTRWRTFPGDVIGRTPTAAETERRQEADEEALGGPRLPEAAEESELGPRPTDRRSREPQEEPAPEETEAAAAPALGGLPGLPPIEPEASAPPPAEEPPAEEAPGPDLGPLPGAEPGGDPLDPFGAMPPAPPAWLSHATRSRAAQAPLPGVRPAAAVSEAAVEASELIDRSPVSNGPNIHNDDAPALPTGLQGLTRAAAHARQAVTINRETAPPPPTPRPAAKPVLDQRVAPASAQTPVGIQLINPASAMVADPGEDGLQQAIYYEASDQ